MAKEIIMPKLSDTMEEGTLVSWKKGLGDRVERGDIIAEIETDKANMELEAFDSGVLLETRAKSGDVVPVGTVIGLIGEPGEKPAEKPSRREKEAEPEEAARPAEKAPEPEKIGAGEIPEEKAVERKAPPEEENREEAPEKVIETPAVEEKASPMVRRMAREMGVDLGDVRGSGPEGRILREDLEKYLKEQAKGEEAGAVKPGVTPGVKKTEPLTRMRAAIAKNVALSWHTIPHFSVSVSVEMAEAEKLRLGAKDAGISLTLNDLVVKAAATALGKYPRLNASFSEEGIVLYPEVNVGVAVSIEGGLLVPVVRGCGKLPLKELAAMSRDLVERAREGKISESELSGGTFTVSNLGMFGVDEFSAVIYPGQAAILAVAAVQDTAVVRGDVIVKSRVMKATLSADHRIVDGADAARFLSELKRILENPFSMLV